MSGPGPYFRERPVHTENIRIKGKVNKGNKNGRMEKKKDWEFFGMKLAKRSQKSTSGMEKKMDWKPVGLSLVKRHMKLITRMGNKKD